LKSIEKPTLKPSKGSNAGPLVAFLHFHRLLDADEALRHVLFFDTSGLQQEYEGTGTAVHDRNFRRGQVHISIVDT
jgi:hypothetical protein